MLSNMNHCFFLWLVVIWLFLRAFNEQLINIHIPPQICDDVLLTSAFVIDLSSSLAINYRWVCNPADCCFQKCNSVTMTLIDIHSVRAVNNLVTELFIIIIWAH